MVASLPSSCTTAGVAEAGGKNDRNRIGGLRLAGITLSRAKSYACYRARRSVACADAFAFCAGDIRVEGPHPFCSSGGGNWVSGRTRTAMYTDSIEQLRGTAGARQVRVGAETGGF